MKKKRSQDLTADIDRFFVNNDLDRKEWQVTVGFSKGMLTGTRGANVAVSSLAHGIKRKKFLPAKTKTEAREKALFLVKELVQKINSEE